MNRKILAATLPLLGGAVLVGAGFGAWAFTETQNVTATASGSVTVTELLDGTVSAKLIATYAPTEGTTAYYDLTADGNSMSVELDQGTIFSPDVSEGITARVTVDGTAYEITGVIVEAYYTPTEGTLANLLDVANITLDNFRLAFTTGDAIATYAKFNTDLSTITAQTITTTTGLPTSRLTTGVTGTCIYQSTSQTFGWTYTNKPTTTETYNAMKTAVNSKTFTINLDLDASWAAKN